MRLFCLIPMAGVLALVLAVASSLSGCSDRERDPLAAYHVDPKAFSVVVIPW